MYDNETKSAPRVQKSSRDPARKFAKDSRREGGSGKDKKVSAEKDKDSDKMLKESRRREGDLVRNLTGLNLSLMLDQYICLDIAH